LTNYAIKHSDLEGLNLNIASPTLQNRAAQAENKLPIFFFIHGGGFQVGSGTFPQYDMARFVRLSSHKSMPLIAVTINYRLGPSGLFTSDELRQAGYQPNNTLRDQLVALQWIRKYIGGFGGDIDNITIAGESAGGVSCTYHLQSTEPLFKRIISMSGTSLLMPLLPVPAAEAFYQQAMKALGLDAKTSDERLKELSTMDAGELRSRTLAVPQLPIVDESLSLASHNFADFPSNKIKIAGEQWCKSIMIGDCEFDGNIQGLRLGHRKKGVARTFCSEIGQALGEHAETIFSGYGISPELDDDTAFVKILETLNDVGFYAPTLAYAKRLSGQGMKTYIYRFNEPNPWDGPYKGRANHILDISFLFQNFNEFLDDSQKRTADMFAEDVIKFVSGQEPWQEWREGQAVAKVLGPHGAAKVVKDEPQEVGRRRILLDLANEVPGGMDRLSEVLNGFLRGPPAT
jgi:carboxylesterase type B